MTAPPRDCARCRTPDGDLGPAWTPFGLASVVSDCADPQDCDHARRYCPACRRALNRRALGFTVLLTALLPLALFALLRWLTGRPWPFY